MEGEQQRLMVQQMVAPSGERTSLIVKDFVVLNREATLYPHLQEGEANILELLHVVCVTQGFLSEPSADEDWTPPSSFRVVGSGTLYVTNQERLFWLRISTPDYPTHKNSLVEGHEGGVGFQICFDCLMSHAVSTSPEIEGAGSSPSCVMCILDEEAIDPPSINTLFFIPTKQEQGMYLSSVIFRCLTLLTVDQLYQALKGAALQKIQETNEAEAVQSLEGVEFFSTIEAVDQLLASDEDNAARLAEWESKFIAPPTNED